MGSSGTGKISDYPGSSKADDRKSGGGNGGAGGSGGGASGGGGADDRCAKAFSTKLEDVEHSEYFQAHGTAPPEGTVITVAHQKRMVATTADGQSIGNLPTAFNYLAACLKNGWQYVGTVRQVTVPVALEWAFRSISLLAGHERTKSINSASRWRSLRRFHSEWSRCREQAPSGRNCPRS